MLPELAFMDSGHAIGASFQGYRVGFRLNLSSLDKLVNFFPTHNTP